MNELYLLHLRLPGLAAAAEQQRQAAAVVRPVDPNDDAELWSSTIDPSSGQMYWYNQRTKKTMWTTPACRQSVIAVPAASGNGAPAAGASAAGAATWRGGGVTAATVVAAVDPNDVAENWLVFKRASLPYFYNQVTKKTTWDMPACLKAAAGAPAKSGRAAPNATSDSTSAAQSHVSKLEGETAAQRPRLESEATSGGASSSNPPAPAAAAAPSCDNFLSRAVMPGADLSYVREPRRKRSGRTKSGSRTSSFIGVSWSKGSKKWQAQIKYNLKQAHLGYYLEDDAAARAYDSFVVTRKIDRRINFPNAKSAAGHTTTKVGKTSNYNGVCWDKWGRKWRAEIWHAGKNKYLGNFAMEVDAARAYDRFAQTINKPLNFAPGTVPASEAREPTAKRRKAHHE